MISIIIPTYNSSSTIERCLHSILSQTFTDWECIVVDDGSTDDTCEKVQRIAEKDSRIVVYQRLSAGVSVTRNYGIAKAHGDFVCFIDSDDYVSSELLAHMMVEPTCQLVIGGYQEIPGRKRCPIRNDRFVCDNTKEAEIVELFQQYLLFGPIAKRYQTAIIRKHQVAFPTSISYGEDLLFNLSYLSHITTITTIPYADYFYIRSSNSLSLQDTRFDYQTNYSQWLALKNFFQSKGMQDCISKDFLYTRLWGIIYDAIFSSNEHIRVILQTKEIEQLKQYLGVFYSSGWIKWRILHRIVFPFYIFRLVKR